MLKSIFRSIFRQVVKRPLHFARRHAKSLLIMYMTGTLPMSYVSTALTTGYQFTDVQNVVNVVKNSGPVNILTGGLAQPLFNSARSVTGSAMSTVGDWLNAPDLVDAGKNMKVAAKSWFDQGKAKVDETIDNVKSIKVSQGQQTQQPADQSTEQPIEQAVESFDFNTYPNYYRVIGLSEIDPATYPHAGSIEYSELDHLGRTGIAKGSLTYDNVKASKGVRHSFKGGDKNKPSGWVKQSKGDEVSIPWLYGKVYRGYFYNQSHLIADVLGGEASRQNAIAGTRTQNVGGTDQKGGMRYSEKIAEKYLTDHQDQVMYYSAEPIYHGDELVARSVIVRMKSSDGSIDEAVEVFNAANGWTIDYMTGEYHAN